MVRPPAFLVAILVVVTAGVVESMGELVAKSFSESSVIEGTVSRPTVNVGFESVDEHGNLLQTKIVERVLNDGHRNIYRK